jgi:hypothetical protein
MVSGLGGGGIDKGKLVSCLTCATFVTTPIMSDTDAQKLPELTAITNHLTLIETRLTLSESVTFAIFKSSLCKGAFDVLFWGHQTLLNRYVSPAEVRLLQRLTNVLGGNRDRRGTEAVRLFQSITGEVAVSGRDADIIVQAQAPQQGTQGKPFLNARTPQQIGVIDNEILK